jgi:ferredoxin
MKRQIIKIDEDKCDGCGQCVPECHEGALQVIDDKVRLISDLFCDGLGACIGHCPQDAITIEEREAEPYNERLVIDEMLKKPKSVLIAHLKHLKSHGAMNFFNEAIEYLDEKGIKNPIIELHENNQQQNGGACGCPGSAMVDLRFKDNDTKEEVAGAKADANPAIPELTLRQESQLRQWPVQLHLVNPAAPYFQDSELTIMSTCGPIASANVHKDYLEGKQVVVACPKLDYTDPYMDKLTGIIQTGKIKKLTVVVMEVPCCKGLAKIAYDACSNSGIKGITLEEHVLSIDGNLKIKDILFKN